MKTLLLVIAFVSVFLSHATALNWPQAAEPDHGWRTEILAPVPTRFTVVNGENILREKQLKAGTQSGIVVWGARLFLSIFKPHTKVEN